MRTTLDLDDDLLAAAKKLARARSLTLGQVISELARKSLAAGSPPKVRNGVPLFAARKGGMRPDLQAVNLLQND